MTETQCRHRLRCAATGILAAVLLQCQGCYYLQAARGHVDILQKRRPIDDVIEDAATPNVLRQRLRLVKEARRFSVDVLFLPDNQSYHSYADLERDHVLWNVFAAPEFSLEPKQWCYPIAGCVGYRGYFSRDGAERKAEKLRRAGFDVLVGGVSAYSTLGRSSDPVLNTMMRWTDLELLSVLFHELAHQKLYVKGDAEFNESFATAVEEFGVERWLESRGESGRLDDVRGQRHFKQQLFDRVQAARERLHGVYASGASAEVMRDRKRSILYELRAHVEGLAQRMQQPVPGWLDAPLNNASLVPIALYQGRVGEFRDLLRACSHDLRCFYARAESLAAR